MMFFRIRTALLLAAGLFPPLAFCAAKGKSEIVLPFRNLQGEMVVTMSLHGHKGMNFIVDTGFGTTMLDASAAAAAHVKVWPLTSPPLQSAAGAIPLTQCAPHTRIEGYGLRLSGNAVVGDLQELQKGMGIPLAGILGFDSLEQFPFLVDYSASTITINPPKLQQGIEVPMEPPIPNEFNGPIIGLVIELPDGRRVETNLIIDTGSTEGLALHAPFVERYGLQPAAEAKTVSELTYGGAYSVTPGSVRALLLGDQRVEDLQPTYTTSAVGVSGNKRIDGEIGYKILSRFRIFMDAPHHVVVFEPASREDAALPTSVLP